MLKVPPVCFINEQIVGLFCSSLYIGTDVPNHFIAVFECPIVYDLLGPFLNIM